MIIQDYFLGSWELMWFYNAVFILLKDLFYQIFFGFLITISFCDFSWIKENFHFLKTTQGRGAFDIFCSSMFLITAEASFSGWLMFSILQVCGWFFVIIACTWGEAAGKDIDSNALKNQAAGAALLN